jgi:hypothetical protein
MDEQRIPRRALAGKIGKIQNYLATRLREERRSDSSAQVLESLRAVAKRSRPD